MYFTENDTVTWVSFDIDVDTLTEAVERSCLVAEDLNFPALRTEIFKEETTVLHFRTHTASPKPISPDFTTSESLLFSAYPALEKFKFAEDRYKILEDEEGTFADLAAPIRFYPKLGVNVFSISGFTANWAQEEYVESNHPFRESDVHRSERVHSVFWNAASNPDDVVVRLQLWLAAADLSTAVGLIRQPLQELDASAVELLPVSTHPGEGYHAALLYTISGDELNSKEKQVLAASQKAAHFYGLTDDRVSIEHWGAEPVSVAEYHQEEQAPMKTRKITEIYARIKYDPLEIVNKDASEKSPDNAPEDLEDSLEENITDKQREEFYEAIQDMEEFLEQVWLVVHADIRCFEPGTAENRFLALINETQPNISDKETRLILEETLEIDTERYRTQVSIHTLERDHNQVLDGAMNSLSGGIWRSYTRPWGNDAKEETIIYWNPNEPEREDSIIEIAVRATHGPPRHLRKE